MYIYIYVCFIVPLVLALGTDVALRGDVTPQWSIIGFLLFVRESRYGLFF